MHILKLEKCDTKSFTVHSGGENPDEGCVVEIIGVLLTISINEKDRCFFRKCYFVKIKGSSAEESSWMIPNQIILHMPHTVHSPYRSTEFFHLSCCQTTVVAYTSYPIRNTSKLPADQGQV